MRHLLVIAALCVVAWCQKPVYPNACDPNDPAYIVDVNAPKLKPVDGFEIFAQTPVYVEVDQDFTKIPELEKPFSETFFIRSFADQKRRGSMYISFSHKMVEMMYDRAKNESMIVDFQHTSCDVKPMVREDDFPFGYFHGDTPFHVPFMDKLLDLTKHFKVKRLRDDWNYRGFRHVIRYEACLNMKKMIQRTMSNSKIPQFLIDAIPDPTAVKVTWHWADPSWEMEDGTFDESSWVPLGIEITSAISIRTQLKGLKINVDIKSNGSMAFANYHSHYPHLDLQNEDLLQAPPGFNCKRDPHETDPAFPLFPPKFHIKTESVNLGDRAFVYNTEDYYDYEQKLFRFDVALHRPDEAKSVKLNLFHDYNKNVAYEINRAERTCKKRDLNADPPHGKWNDNIIMQLLMRPYEILNLADINPNYIGKKKCRGMNCHYWVGQKDLSTKVEGKDTYGIFGIWATTHKWSQNFSTPDPMMRYFIVEMDVEVREKGSTPWTPMLGRHHLQIFDYKQITSNLDVYFRAPTEEFCGGTEDPGKQPFLPTRYQYRGEYSDSFTASSIPIFMNYDVDWNVVRFDWIPAMFDTPDKKTMKYRQSYVYDRTSGTNYQVNVVNGECNIVTIPPEYQGEDIDPLHILWPPRLHEQITSRNMRYVGVQPCRRMTCDTFELEEPRGKINHIYEYQFTTENFKEISIDNPFHEESKVLARIARFRMENGEHIPDRFRSVDIFSYVDLRSVYWEYEIVAPCFVNVYSQWIRLYFTADSPDALKYIRNDYFRVEMMEAVRKNASSITPLRIADFLLEKSGDNRIVAEFKLRDRHPREKYPGPSLADAISNLRDGIATGAFNVKITIPPPDPSQPTVTYTVTADTSLEQCDKPCSMAQWAMPTVELDTGALAGTIIGSIIAGLVVVFVVLTIIVSRKHQVPMQSLYIGTVPGTGVAHDLPPVSMSSGIGATGGSDD